MVGEDLDMDDIVDDGEEEEEEEESDSEDAAIEDDEGEEEEDGDDEAESLDDADGPVSGMSVCEKLLFLTTCHDLIFFTPPAGPKMVSP
jgi:hypothetical protein